MIVEMLEQEGCWKDEQSIIVSWDPDLVCWDKVMWDSKLLTND